MKNTRIYRWLDEDGYICIQEAKTQKLTSAEKHVRHNDTMKYLKKVVERDEGGERIR